MKRERITSVDAVPHRIVLVTLRLQAGSVPAHGTSTTD